MPNLGFREFKFPQIVAGIYTLKCASCDFSFCYVIPEEAESAYLAMAEHFHEKHPSRKPQDMSITIFKH
jgi:hypothetical protein